MEGLVALNYFFYFDFLRNLEEGFFDLKFRDSFNLENYAFDLLNDEESDMNYSLISLSV